jgi:hypothetical protein
MIRAEWPIILDTRRIDRIGVTTSTPSPGHYAARVLAAFFKCALG